MISTSARPARQPSGQTWRYRSSKAFRARHRNFLPWRVPFVLVLALALLGPPGAHSAGIPDTAPAGTLANQVTWLASTLGSHTVRPGARRQPVLVLETINTYSRTRVLRALLVEVCGTPAENEFESWELYADDNGNGSIDDGENPLAVAAPFSGDGVEQVHAEDLRDLRFEI